MFVCKQKRIGAFIMFIENDLQQAGYEAFFKGVSNDFNPYELDDDNGLHWDIGWKLAHSVFKYYIPCANQLPV